MLLDAMGAAAAPVASRNLAGAIRAANSTAVSNSGGDSNGSPVTISDAGRHALAAERLPTVSEEAAREGIPEEMVLCQVAPWLSDFGFKVSPSDPEFAQMHPQAATAPPDVLKRFGTKIFEHIAAAGAAAGGPSGPSLETYHLKMITDKQSSEQIRQQFVAGIRQDPELMGLMERLGVTGMLPASDMHAAQGAYL